VKTNGHQNDNDQQGDNDDPDPGCAGHGRASLGIFIVIYSILGVTGANFE
jgi:hypothetical protein